MKIQSLIAAVSAEHLAIEAKERAILRSVANAQGQANITKLTKKAIEKPLTQAQMKRGLLKEKWRPHGYIFAWELLDLAGLYKFKEWSGEEFNLMEDPPKCLQVSDALDPDNIEELIWYALSNNLIKEGIRQPPSLSGGMGISQGNWRYLHRVGKFIDVEKKEEAIDGWLKESAVIVEDNRQYNAALKRVGQVKIFLRDALYAGKIKAVSLCEKNLEDIPRLYWLEDKCEAVFDIQNLSSDIIFEHKSVARIIAKNKQDVSDEKGLITVSSGGDIIAAVNLVYTECRSRGCKLNNLELQELVNRILKDKGKILSKSWHKTSADIPPDLKRQRGERGKCPIIIEN